MNKVGKLSSHGGNVFSIGNDAGESCNVVNISRGQWKIVCFEADSNVVADRLFLSNKRESVLAAKEYLKLDRNEPARAGKAISAAYAIIDAKN